MRKLILIIAVLFSMCCGPLVHGGNLQIPSFFSDHIVLQRDMPVKVWGHSQPGSQVAVTLLNTRVEQTTITLDDGSWEIELPAQKAGGPYELCIKSGEESHVISDVLFGEVWLCSGQSNMEFKVKEAQNAEREIACANYPMIRSLNVPHVLSNQPQSEVNTQWQVCSPATVGNFTAVGYFYARELYKTLNVPVGIINASWGSTGIRTWMSRSSFDTLPGSMKEDYDSLALNDFDQFERRNAEYKKLYAEDLANDRGLAEEWYNPETDFSAWKEINVPCAWVSTELGHTLGNVWYCRTFQLPAMYEGCSATLSLGKVDDGDETWVNGVKVGESQGPDKRRIYQIDAHLLKPGENTIVVKVNNSSYTGGFIGLHEDYYLDIATSGKLRIPLSGKWKFRKSAASIDYGYVEILPNVAPSLLYNAMIRPFVKYGIKGVIWYQGEHDTRRARDYRTMFPVLIRDWRGAWGYDFPFLWVSLANMDEEDEIPRKSPWAELREAQTKTLSEPHTGQAVIYDIGDAHNIHPVNKQEVGRRLALIARNKVYGERDLVCEGPVCDSWRKRGDCIEVSFRVSKSGLCVKNNKYGYVTGFSIAGEDKQFHWAKARIEGNKVIVYSEKVKNPVAVRYAWANNPGANLCNRDGLMAVPFRSDSWE